jgi:hypothetical protein
MPRDGAIIFSDLIGKLDMLRVSVRNGLAKLIDKRGRDGKIVDWLEELTADCPKKKSLLNMSDRCERSASVISPGTLPEPTQCKPQR